MCRTSTCKHKLTLALHSINRAFPQAGMFVSIRTETRFSLTLQTRLLLGLTQESLPNKTCCLLDGNPKLTTKEERTTSITSTKEHNGQTLVFTLRSCLLVLVLCLRDGKKDTTKTDVCTMQITSQRQLNGLTHDNLLPLLLSLQQQQHLLVVLRASLALFLLQAALFLLPMFNLVPRYSL